MDETQQSRASDAAAAATRKRRSSILKSQRPPRTPFSELEFHVATPTDTAKSRRVSFSRRTGVAEFITNEATTTWKNFYEEHNKSLESSGNDSAANPPKPSIGHLGKRMFDQQFEEVEAVDFITSLDNHSSRNINTSLNKVNFTQQLASLECTTGEKSLLNPRSNLEMSAFTDHQSNVFGDDFAIPTMGEMSGRIDVNFSAVQALGSGEIKDDLDEIQEDLRRAQTNVVCPGPFSDRRDLSEYIEVDLNCTHGPLRNDDDMSITDTIHSPKVQEVSKSNSIRINKSSDWVADKENIAVFEGCTTSKSTTEKRKTIVYENDAGNISITQALPVNIILPEQVKPSEKRKTIIYESDSADISVTQAVPVNIMIVNKDKEKRKTIIYENDTGDISVTQAIPSKIILPNKNKTIISEDDLGNISITQAIPIVKIISSNISQAAHKSISTEDCISNVSSQDNNDKHRTIYGTESLEISGFDNNMSITKPIDAKLLSEALKSSHVNQIKSEINQSISASARHDIFVYQASAKYNENVPKDASVSNKSQIKNASDYELKGNMSIRFSESESKQSCVKVESNLFNDEAPILKKENYDENYKILSSKENDAYSEIKEKSRLDEDLIENKENVVVHEDITSPLKPASEKRKTIVYDDDIGNLSITQALPANIILSSENKTTNKRKTIVYDTDEADISVTQAVPVNILLVNKETERNKTVVYDNEDICNISVTQAIPTNIILPNNKEPIDSEYEIADISLTQAVPVANIISTTSEVTNKTVSHEIEKMDVIPDKNREIINENESENPPISNLNNVSISNKGTPALSREALQKSVIEEILNKSNSILIRNELMRSINAKRVSQDLYVYQAGMSHDDVVMKDSSQLDIAEKEDDYYNNIVSNRTSVSFTKSEGKDSFVEVNKSMQISRTPLLTLETAEKPEKDVSNQIVPSNALKEDTKLIPVNTTDAKLVEKSRQTILDDLLDMSQMSLDGTADKSVTADIQSEEMPANMVDNTSNNSTVYSIKDSDNETQTEEIDDMVIKETDSVKQLKAPLALEYKEELEENMSFDILKKILKTKLSEIQEKSPKNRQYEEEPTSRNENDKSMNKSVDREKLESPNAKSFKDVNDTNELLEMLSDMTDKTRISDAEVLKEAVSSRPSRQSEANEPRRLSVAPNRLSIVLSREDLLNNISMAQAALQRSIEIDESIADTSITPEERSPPKPARVSNEVVKKLHFEDESASETSVKSDVKSSPLKKTAFGEIENTRDNKAKVIPSYLQDVSEEIKSLMSDLVKPNADVLPFSAITKGQHLHRDPSTCSTQIQANLTTSSQIDVNAESNSASTSSYNLALSTPSFSTDYKSFKNTSKFSEGEKVKSVTEAVIAPKLASPARTMSDRVIIFDQNNPLNNVLLAPPNYSDVHRYQPESIPDELEKASANNMEHSERQNVTQYTVEILGNVDNSFCNKNKSTCAPEPVRVHELKDIQVNTLIAMKQNRELLETSSSLTLVDDALTKNNLHENYDTASEGNRVLSPEKNTGLRVKIICPNEEQDLLKNEDSNISSNDEPGEPVEISKGKKRIYSPSTKVKDKHSGLASQDVTPKQVSKMQKLSTSPFQPDKSVQKLEAEKDDNGKMEVDTFLNYSKEKKISPRKTKQASSITVQRLSTEYDLHGNIDQDTLNKHIINALSKSGSSLVPNSESITGLNTPEVVSSFTSSKNQIEMRDARSVTTTDTKSSARSSKSEWKPESIVNGSGMTSECDSSVNVVAKIDMLPFMGSYECEWEPCTSDTWSFRLLHARLRLTVRLAHRHDNATRTRVRADTPVLGVALDIAHSDKKNSVATFCVNFAAEAMRHYIASGWSSAGEIPLLLRRCAGVARVALRWGRAMHEARLHLAYTLRPDGTLALKLLIVTSHESVPLLLRR